MVRIPLYVIRLFLLVVLLVVWSPRPEEFHEIPPLVHVDDVLQKKLNFIEYMKPIIKAENDHIRRHREQLVSLHQVYLDRGDFSSPQQETFDRLCQYYRVSYADPEVVDVWIMLFRRIDIVPLELALAQSAAESAWGTSRFARMGNSFFGQWSYKSTGGIKPFRRGAGKKHRVASFKSVQESARSYMTNLNTHWAYEKFRQLRYDQRQRGERPNGFRLAGGLEMYSQRRALYVTQIRNIIKNNRKIMGTK